MDKILLKLSPSLHKRLKQGFRMYKKKTNPTLTKEEFISLLKDDLKIKKDDTVFIHSSMRNVYVDFGKDQMLEILLTLVGENGTLAFPCWHFNTRAEDYIKEHNIVFDIRNSPSAMGKIPEVLRANPNAYRSFHPTNSVIAIGRNAKDLTAGHESDIYPCGIQSPFFKLMKYSAKILGIGVTVDNLTFVHTVEDTLKDTFPVKTRNDEVYPCRCIDSEGNERIITTMVASKAIGHRDVFGFFKKHVTTTMYRPIRVKNMDFFSLDALQTYDQLKSLALSGKSIYHF